MKKNRTCVDSALEELSKLQKDPRLTCRMKDQIQTLEMELGCLNMYIWWLSMSNGALLSTDEDSESLRKSHVKSTIGKAIRKGLLYQSGVSALEKGEFEEWDDLVFKLLDKIQQCSPKMKKTCEELHHSWSGCELSTSEILKFLEINFISLDHFVRYYSYNLLPILDDMKRKTDFFMKLLNFTGKRCRYSSAWHGLRNQIGEWASEVGLACLYLYSITLEEDFKARNEEHRQSRVASKLEFYLSFSLENMMPYKQEDMSAYIEILTASKVKSSTSSVSLMGEILFDLVDLLLESPVFHVKKDVVDNIRVALIFLISFLVDSPNSNANPAEGELILTRAKDVLSNIASYITSQIEEENDNLILLPDLLQEVITVKAEVRDLYTLTVSTFHFPRIEVPRSIDSLLIDLKEKLEDSRCSSTSFLKHQLSTVHEEFFSLGPLLKNVLRLQNEHRELKDLWIRIANVSHRTKYAVNSLFYRSDSVWQDIICLSDAMEEIKQIKCDIEKIQQDHQMYDTRVANSELSSGSLLPVQVDTSRIKELVVQLKDQEDDIIGHLLRGTSKLHIVAICGTGGLGKTTLARKVYNDPSVQSHFHKYAWCTVSQTYRGENILLNILSQVTYDEVSKMKETDLAMKLYQTLKGQRYLIIIDDIWDIKAWDAVKQSFPDDDNKSRIIFTTRIHDLAKSDSIVRPLRPLSKDESWKLLQMKLFQKDDCPPNFSELGKKIADDCKGLPLAIVLIAGLLSRDVHNLNWWKNIARSLGSQIASEGGTKIVELSYKHLPEFLKPCFLYFGVFREDKVIRVQKLIQL